MSGPVFGKPSRRSKEHKDHSYASNAPFESTTEAAAPPNKRSSLRTSAATDAHLRIVSLQIGEREAVHAMKDLCEECSTSFGVSAKVDEVVDALSGVLVVGDLLRRLGREKSHLEQTLERRTREHDVTLGHKHELMEQMEAMIARLQAEAAQAEDRAQEAAMRHTHRVTLLNKEMQNVREELAEVRGENEQLRAQLEAQQAALMNVPRLEEQFMRNARSAVRQSEVANTLNRIEFRKMEEELRSLTFWKNKAKALQETIGRLSAAVDQLDAQNRLNLSRYQNLLRATRNGSGSGGGGGGGGGGDAAPFAAPVAAAATTTPTTATATATAKGRGARRPLSAPSTRRSASATTVRPAAAAAAAPASPVAALDAGGSVSVSGSGAAAATAAGAAAGGANAAEEILRLRGELRAKERLVVTLAQRLSFARSRPLLATTDDDDAAVAAAAAGDAADATHDDDGDGGGDEAQQRPATLSAQAQRDRDEALAMRSANPLIGVALGDLPYMRDAADDSSLARAEDAALHDERVARAVALQLQYAARQHERRLQGPPHVVAIRQARSFGRVVDELVAQRDAAFLSQKLATSQRDIMFAAL